MMRILFNAFFVIGVCSGQNFSYERGIERPCPGLDLKCIRSFFARHSRCWPSNKPNIDFYYKDHLIVPVPHANVTFIWKGCYTTGINKGKIREFYINHDTGKLLIEVEFGEVTTYTTTATIKYYFKGREPLELTDHATVKYGKVSHTVTMPFDPVKGINWSERDIYLYFGDPPTLPKAAGHGLCNTHCEVVAAYDKLVSDLALSVREGSLYKGPYYFDLYFEKNICKF